MNLQKRLRPQRGFTMIEVLVALLVTAVGLLGLLKIQALAISSTKEAGTRGLVAAQVESLTAAMHANPLYWAMAVPADGTATSGPPPAEVDIADVTINDATLSAVKSGGCGTCTPKQLAAYDVQTWAQSMFAQFPTYSAKVFCTQAVPVNCAIYVTWKEKQVALNATTTSNSAATLSFSVYVQP